ncbi:hypothetical protein CHUAL_003991 [Chamberlinius hualienensis]
MVIVNAHIPGLSIHNYSLSFSDRYIKICTRQYVLELFLANEVECKKSSVKIGKEILIHLKKKNAIHWNYLEQCSSEDGGGENYKGKNLTEHRQNEIKRMGEMFRCTTKNSSDRRQQMDVDVRQQHQTNIADGKERLKKQIEMDKMETLNNWSQNCDSTIETNNQSRPIRKCSNIQVEFTESKKNF